MAQIIALLTLTLLLLLSPTLAAQPFKALVVPITQSNYLFSITLNQNEKLVIDLASPVSWHHCYKGYPRVSCHAPQCLAVQKAPPPKFCHNQNSTIAPQHPCSCLTFPYNPIVKSCAPSQLSYTNVSVSSTDGHNPLAKANFNKIFTSCAPKPLLLSLPKGTSGFASLSQGPLSLVSQFSSNSKVVPKQFGICFGDQGVAFFGQGPFYLLPPPGRDVTQLLGYTPLVKHPRDMLSYYIDLKGISVNGEAVKFDPLGNSLVKLSTITPYTTLRSNIYKVVLSQFSKATSGTPRVPKVKPFDLCLNTTNLGSTRVGLPVPPIDLRLRNGVNWTIWGANSMKQVSNHVACLAFVDGGVKAKEAMVIGTYQVQHNFLLFDLVRSRLGFSSLLFFFQTTCNNFNFTSGVN